MKHQTSTRLHNNNISRGGEGGENVQKSVYVELSRQEQEIERAAGTSRHIKNRAPPLEYMESGNTTRNTRTS